MNFYSIGTDTEVFAKDTAGTLISLCGKIGGTKQHPKQVEGAEKGFAVQEDNVSVEFNIPPTKDRFVFRDNIDFMMNHISNILYTQGLEISKDSAGSFLPSQLTHPQALIFGCEPDFNAWTKHENNRPYCDDINLRTAGGHVHVGTDLNMVKGVRNMDLFLGVPSIILDDSPSSTLRRNLYGKAGAMRAKSYGFEYRVLSNFWVFNGILINWVYKNTAMAIGTTFNPSKQEALQIQNCINQNDRSLALSLIDKYNIPMPMGL
jgi:hypothetical protein